MNFFEGGSELVTLAAFASEQEFLVVRALLESEGIECFCPNLYSGLYTEGRTHRGITLQVRQEDLAKARAILEAPCEPGAEGE
jgi:Putative prokaryotic signal transducing protein